MIYKTFNVINLKKNPIIIIGSGPAGITLALELDKYLKKIISYWKKNINFHSYHLRVDCILIKKY